MFNASLSVYYVGMTSFRLLSFFSLFSGNINIIIKPKIDGKINRISDLTEGF